MVYSAIFAAHPDSATVIVRDKIMDGTIVPLYNAEIFDEYRDVLTRPKFHFPAELVDAILDVILQKGLSLERTKTEEVFTDPKDVVFYEIALSKEGALWSRLQNCSGFLTRWNRTTAQFKFGK